MKLAIGTQPSNVAAGSWLQPAVTIQIEGASGATVTSSSNAVTLTIGNNPVGGVLSGSTTVNAANGVATFPGLAIDKPGVGYTLSASSTGLAGATSTPFTVSAPVPQATTLTLASSANPSINGKTVNFTAALSPSSGAGTSTSGETVTFFVNGTQAGTGTLSGGVATWSTGVLPVGSASSNAVQARYLGDPYYAPSTTATVGQEVDAPVYTWKSVAISGAGALVSGLVVHPQAGGPVYIRTDVGGAYRWNASASRWVSISDTLPFEQRQFYSCESLAIDPSNVNVVYYAGGLRVSGPSAILKSTNQGATWTVLTPGLSGVPMAGNADRRWIGERIAVDPGNSNVLLFGSRTTGLWRSTNGGVNWTQVASVPVAADVYGVQAVLFDPSATGRVYVAVSGSGVYRSIDDGVTFTAIGGSTSPRRLAVASNGTLWYTNGSGVSKYSGAGTVWTNYTPGPTSSTSGQIYSGLAVNPQNPSDILVGKSEYFYQDTQLYRSKDAGATWSRVNYSVTSPVTWFNPYLQSNPWKLRITALAFDNSNPSTVWSNQWQTTDIDGAKTNGQPVWTQLEAGHEEDVMNALIAPPSGPYELLTGSFDDDGFAMNNGLDAYASTQLGIVGGNNANTWGMAYEESNPLNMVRIGGESYFGGTAQNVATSSDSGATWKRIAAYPSTLFPAMAVMSATDNKSIMIVASSVYSSDPTGGSWPSSLTAVNPWRYTLDGGTTWNVSSGLPTPIAYVGQTNFPVSLAADKIAGSTYYYYFDDQTVNPRVGRLFRSTDSGATFTQVNSNTSIPGKPWHQLKARPGVQGDLWLSTDDDSLNYQSFENRPSATEGLYHSSDGGQTWSKLTNVTRAFTFGFGAPAAGGPAALYLYGRANGATADSIYRSIDLGATWLNIQDPANSLGDFPAYLEGSRQTFGRVFVGLDGRGTAYGSSN